MQSGRSSFKTCKFLYVCSIMVHGNWFLFEMRLEHILRLGTKHHYKYVDILQE